MPNITINDIEYNTEDLIKNGKAQLASLKFLEVQLQKLRNEMAINQSAQPAYVAALKAEIAEAGIEPLVTDAQPDE